MGDVSKERKMESIQNKRRWDLLTKDLDMTEGTIYQKDIWNLMYLITDITPYGMLWRWGFVRSLRKAIRLIRNEERMNQLNKEDQ